MQKVNEIDMKEDYEKHDSVRLALDCFSYGSFTRHYWSFCDTSWEHARPKEDARAFSAFWTYVYSRPTTARTRA